VPNPKPQNKRPLPILGNGAKAPHVTISREKAARYGQVTSYSTLPSLTSTAPRCSEGYVGLSRRRRRRSSRLGRLCWIVTAQSACLAARKVMLDCDGAGLGAPRRSEGYVGLSRRSRRASRLGRLCWIVTAQASALLATRKVMLDCHGAVGAPRGSEGYVGL
jgi:hypothetical protein